MLNDKYKNQILKHTQLTTFASYDFTGTDMSYAQLAGVRFKNCHFGGTNMAGAKLEAAHFTECSFVGCQLTVAHLARCTFDHCTFSTCNFSAASLPSSTWARCELDRCDLSSAALNKSSMISITITNGRLQATKIELAHLEIVTFRDCQMNTLSLGGSSIKGLTMRSCAGDHVSLAACSARQLVITDSQLPYLLLSQATLKHCTFEESKMPGCLLSQASVRSSTFNQVRMGSSQASAAQVHNCDFTGCDLNNSKWRLANITRSSFLGSDLADATILPGPECSLPPYGRWDLSWQPDGMITIGCQKKHLDQWVAFFDGTDELATPRMRGDFARIRAGFEYARAMWEIHQKEIAGQLVSQAGTPDGIEKAAVATKASLDLIHKGTAEQRQPASGLYGTSASMVIIDDLIQSVSGHTGHVVLTDEAEPGGDESWVQLGHSQDGRQLWWQPMQLAEPDEAHRVAMHYMLDDLSGGIEEMAAELRAMMDEPDEDEDDRPIPF